MKKIEKIIVKHEIDGYPDLSYIGEYTDEIEDDLICRLTGEYYKDMSEDDIPDKGRYYRSFKPYAGGEKPGTKDYYKYGLQDFARMEKIQKKF